MKKIIIELYEELRKRKKFSSLPKNPEWDEKHLLNIYKKGVFFSIVKILKPEDKKQAHFISGRALDRPTNRFLVALLSRHIIEPERNIKNIFLVLNIDNVLLSRYEDDLALPVMTIVDGIKLFNLNPVFIFDKNRTSHKILID